MSRLTIAQKSNRSVTKRHRNKLISCLELRRGLCGLSKPTQSATLASQTSAYHVRDWSHLTGAAQHGNALDFHQGLHHVRLHLTSYPASPFHFFSTSTSALRGEYKIWHFIISLKPFSPRLPSPCALPGSVCSRAASRRERPFFGIAWEMTVSVLHGVEIWCRHHWNDCFAYLLTYVSEVHYGGAVAYALNMRLKFQGRQICFW